MKTAYELKSKVNCPPVLVDLVYLRVSQINHCAYCLDIHTRELLKKARRSKSWRSCRHGGKRGLYSTTVSVLHSRGPNRSR